MQRNGLNIRTLREFALVEKSLAVLKLNSCSPAAIPILFNTVHAMLATSPRVTDVLCFALFTAATLGSTATNEKHFKMNRDGTECLDDSSSRNDVANKTVLRNLCLRLFFSLLYSGKRIHTKYCEDVVQVNGSYRKLNRTLQYLKHPKLLTLTIGCRI